MNKWSLIIIGVFAILLCANMVRGISNTLLETPKYKVIKKATPYEVREYEPMIIARTRVSSDYKRSNIYRLS